MRREEREEREKEETEGRREGVSERRRGGRRATVKIQTSQ